MAKRGGFNQKKAYGDMARVWKSYRDNQKNGSASWRDANKIYTCFHRGSIGRQAQKHLAQIILYILQVLVRHS